MAKFKIPKAKFKATWPGSSIWPLPPTTNMSMLPPPYPIVALPSRLNCYSALPVQSPPPTIHYQPPAPSYYHHCDPIVTTGPITIVAGYDPTVTGALLLPLPRWLSGRCNTPMCCAHGHVARGPTGAHVGMPHDTPIFFIFFYKRCQ